MDKNLFVTIMNELTEKVEAYDEWLNEVEMAFGDGAVNTILSKANPLEVLAIISTITGISEDDLIAGFDAKVNWETFYDTRV